MTAPTVRVLLSVFIREDWFNGSTMQGPLDHIAGREGVWWQVREAPFVDHPCACHSNGTLLFPCRRRRHDHARERSLRPHRDLWAIREAAHHLAFGALLHLIGGTCRHA